MKSDPHNVESYSMLNQVEMSPEKRDAIWRRLEEELAIQPTVRKSKRRNVRTPWTSGAAAAAALVIAAGGIWELANRDAAAPSPTASTSQGPTQKTEKSQAYGTKLATADVTSAQGPASIHTLSIQDGMGVRKTYWPKDDRAAAAKVEGWLSRAGTIQFSPSKTVPQGPYRGAGPILQFITSKRQTVVIGQPGNAVQPGVSDILAVRQGNKTTYISSKPLYDWLMNGQWKSQFYNGDELLRAGNLKLGMRLAAVQQVLGAPSRKTIVHGNGGPEWIYKQQGIILEGDPVWQIEWTAPYKGSLSPGIQIGSTMQAVLDAYPGADLYVRQGQDTFIFNPIPGSADQIILELKDGRVSRMTIDSLVP